MEGALYPSHCIPCIHSMSAAAGSYPNQQVAYLSLHLVQFGAFLLEFLVLLLPFML